MSVIYNVMNEHVDRKRSNVEEAGQQVIYFLVLFKSLLGNLNIYLVICQQSYRE